MRYVTTVKCADEKTACVGSAEPSKEADLMSLERCIRCDGPHKPQRCKDCHVYGRAISMGRAGFAYRWHHDVGCSHYHPRHYSVAEQEQHREAFGGKPTSDGYCGTTGELALECAHCWAAADYDAGDDIALD